MSNKLVSVGVSISHLIKPPADCRGAQTKCVVQARRAPRSKNAGGILETQPWSWKAVFLYLASGFKLQKRDSFAQYVNEYDKAIGELKKIVTEKQFEILLNLSES